jgi:hypothetical protein
LEGDRAKKGRVICTVDFWEEGEEGSVYAGEVDVALVEGVKDSKNIRGYRIPKGGEKGGTKTITTWTRQPVHGEEGQLNLIAGKRGAEGHKKRGTCGIERPKVETPGGRANGT